MTQEMMGRGRSMRPGMLGAVALAATLTVVGSAGAQTEAAADSPPAVEGPAAAEPSEESSLLADDSPAPASESAESAPPAEGAPPAEAAKTDGPRFRFGVSGGFGLVAIPGLTALYTGVDLRFGVQINDLIAVYAQPQLGGYWGEALPGIVGTGGLVGASAVVDFTFIDRMFVGGGVGYAVLNSPSGVELHLRAGGYPLMKKYDDRARRKGLMVGLDFRIHLIDGVDPIVSPILSVGYEAF